MMNHLTTLRNGINLSVYYLPNLGENVKKPLPSKYGERYCLYTFIKK